MKGPEVYEILKKINATHLHHANSVTTSCTFLEHRALLSRGFIESHGFKQTPQSSDADDKRHSIWDLVFLDHVDIHARGGRRKGPNQYGPALFALDLDVMLHLPENTEILVAKKNPIYWQEGEPNNEKWFQTAEELAQSIRFGDFNKMLMIRTPSGKLDFPTNQVEVILDDPQRQLSNGENAFDHAEKRLNYSATSGKIKLALNRRICQGGCLCVEKYAEQKVGAIDLYFG
jgi:hypothetical protein